MKKIARITNKNALSIKIESIEWIYICLILALSFFNNATLIISILILLLSLVKQKEVGIIKILNIMTVRTIINPGIAVNISNFQNFKWIILLLGSFYLISRYTKLPKNIKRKTKKICISIIMFAFYNIMSSLFFSSLPIVAIFKISSYILVFLGVLVGVIYTYDKFDWVQWMYKVFFTIVIISLPMLFSPIGYLRNGHAFQGITNQPNMFGIILVLFTGLILTKLQYRTRKNSIKLYGMLSIVFYLILLSKSRTSFIAFVILFVLYIYFANIKRLNKIIVFNFGAIFSVFYLLIDRNIINFFRDFLMKGQSSLLYSRLVQVEGLLSNFLANPWFGSGFAVPVLSTRVFDFSQNHVVEPGNLLLAVLSYGGIIGFSFFLIYMVQIIWINKKNFRNQCYLPISTVLISMGEMVFFSSNNIGIWLYMFLAIYVVNNNKKMFL